MTIFHFLCYFLHETHMHETLNTQNKVGGGFISKQQNQEMMVIRILAAACENDKTVTEEILKYNQRCSRKTKLQSWKVLGAERHSLGSNSNYTWAESWYTPLLNWGKWGRLWSVRWTMAWAALVFPWDRGSLLGCVLTLMLNQQWKWKFCTNFPRCCRQFKCSISIWTSKLLSPSLKVLRQ